ncbi:MAG: hypothetical protein C4326_02575 [Ignavibacteria bacterium]
MNRLYLFFALICCLALVQQDAPAQTYQGTQYCQLCHSGAAGNQYTVWQNTLHAKIHLRPDTISVRPLDWFTRGDSVSVGIASAKVYLSRVGNDYFARVGAGGTNYKIAYTYGWGFKQRYLVKIDTSYYMLPIQYNLKGYLNNTTGSWVPYNASNWFNTDGTPKPINNTFRTKSWDKNCMGCHITGGRVERVVVGTDTSWRATWANNSSDLNMTIGCEACHGPSTGGAGPGHQMNPRTLPSKRAKLEVYGQCHNRASSWRGPGLVGTHEYNKNELNNTYFNPGDTTHPLSEFMNFGMPANGPGGPGTWYDGKTARQHHQQYQEILGSRHFTTPFVEITCFTCHASHKGSGGNHLLVDSLTVGTTHFRVDNADNTLCLACHATHEPFQAIQPAWVQNEPAYRDSIGRYVNQHSRHSVYDPLNTLNTGGSGRCSKCHMAKTAITAVAYDIHTHTFAVVPPVQTLRYRDSTRVATGMLNSCAASCHRNPSGSTAAVPSFGIPTDPTLTNWAEPTDLALADTLWRYWQAWGFTGVRELAHAVPATYTLSQNYPNPFNPSTHIIVELPQQSDVMLAVYNIIGERVATLMQGEFKAGRYEVTWQGKDDFGLQLATGVYLYRLDAGNTSMTKKMILLR